MPKMPESDSKEETAESIAEKKEQVKSILPRWTLEFSNQERLKQLEAKQKEKERNEKYSKLKTKAKDERAKMRDKVGGGGEEENYSMEAVNNLNILCSLSTNWTPLQHHLTRRRRAQTRETLLGQRKKKWSRTLWKVRLETEDKFYQYF